MKKNKLFLLFVIILPTIFLSVVYQSCVKDPCSGVICYNGGACSNGNCVCAPGYTGQHCESVIVSNIYYQNDTYTPIIITINGTNTSIPVGGSVGFTGNYGSSISGSATTSGLTSSNTIIGDPISWTIDNTFSGSNQTIYLDVPSTFFFLKITNISAYNITKVQVNYGLTGGTTDNILIPNDGATYPIGYYPAYTNSNVYLSTAGAPYWNYGISLPFTINQYYNFTAN